MTIINDDHHNNRHQNQVLNAACSANNRELQSILKEVLVLKSARNYPDHYLYFSLLLSSYNMLVLVLCQRQVRFMTNRLKLKDEEDKVLADYISISVSIFIRGRA